VHAQAASGVSSVSVGLLESVLNQAFFPFCDGIVKRQRQQTRQVAVLFSEVLRKGVAGRRWYSSCSRPARMLDGAVLAPRLGCRSPPSAILKDPGRRFPRHALPWPSESVAPGFASRYFAISTRIVLD